MFLLSYSHATPQEQNCRYQHSQLGCNASSVVLYASLHYQLGKDAYRTTIGMQPILEVLHIQLP